MVCEELGFMLILKMDKMEKLVIKIVLKICLKLLSF